MPTNKPTQDVANPGHEASGAPRPGGTSEPTTGEDVTRLLHRLREGDERALEELLPLVYSELRRLARRRLRGAQQTLNTTAVVHEAFLKLAATPSPDFNDRVHFYAVASRAMRQVLTDYARRRTAEKRGGQRKPVDLEDRHIIVERQQAAWMIDLDQALDRLRELSPRLAQVVECRYFGGMTDEEVATVLGVTDRTVRRDWNKARAWLHRELSAEPSTGS